MSRDLKSSNVGFLRIIVSEKTSEVSVKVSGLAGRYTGAVALLSPSDPYLTLRESCISNALTEPRTTFMFVPLGKYRIFIVDEKFQNDVAAYGPRFPEIPEEQEVTAVEASEEGVTEVTATYIEGRAVERAIHEAGPIR